MVPFTLEAPRSIAFGEGTLSALPSALGGQGRRVLVLSGSRWFDGSGWKRRLGEILSPFRVEFLSCPPGEPSTDSLGALRDAARAQAPEAIVAVGGGSVLDTAKALSFLLTVPGPVDSYLEGVPGMREIATPGIPWIAVPTTAGTGAEATKNSVVRAPSLGVKRSMRSVHLLASSVIVDPRLTEGLPAAVTGTSGLDALTQLVEAYVSRKSTPPVRALVRSAFLPMVDALRRLSVDLSDAAARSDAAYGALVSGIALANAGLGAAHGFAAGIGGAYDIPHGLICAVCLPHVLAVNAPAIRDAAAELAGVRAGSGDPVEWLAGEAKSLLGAFGLPGGLKRFDIPASRIPELARLSAGSSMRGNPVELTDAQKEGILSLVVGQG
jgi:alcohol dehydrogenase class IV